MSSKVDSEYILRWAKRIRAINLLGGRCNSCGESDIRFLEFHHKNPDDKDDGISYLTKGRWSKIENEIKKCVLLCRNCHGEFHCINSTRLNEAKSKFLEIRGQNKCSMCGYSGKNNGSLDFHHRNGEEKDFAIGNAFRFVTDMMPKVIDEINKCDVICKNCHNIRHHDAIRFEQFRAKIYQKVIEHKEQIKKVSVKNVLTMYRGGKIQKDIALKLGCAESTISSILSRAKVERKRLLPEKTKVCKSCKNDFKCVGKRAINYKKYCSPKCKHDGDIKLKISKSKLAILLKTETYSGIARKFNVVHNTVRNLAKKYGLIGGIAEMD